MTEIMPPAFMCLTSFTGFFQTVTRWRLFTNPSEKYATLKLASPSQLGVIFETASPAMTAKELPGTPLVSYFSRQLETPKTSNYYLKNKALGFPGIQKTITKQEILIAAHIDRYGSE